MLADLKKELESRVTIDEYVMALMYSIDEDTIKKQPSDLFKAIFNLQSHYDIPKQFRFIFDKSSIIPYSEDLADVLFRLETSTVLSTGNPSYDHYNIQLKKEVLGEAFQKFDNVMQDTIRQMGKELRETYGM